MIKNERGFTIMELLVVIVIIGVLAAIGVPAYNNMTARARTTACDANKRIISTGVGMYYAEHGAYKKLVDGAATGNTIELTDLAGFLDNAGDIQCPVRGTYSIGADGKVTCSVHDKASGGS